MTVSQLELFPVTAWQFFAGRDYCSFVECFSIGGMNKLISRGKSCLITLFAGSRMCLN